MSTPFHAHSPTAGEAGERAGRGVMLVDDEVSYIDLLQQLLSEHLSCPVHGFTRPQAALAALPMLDIGLIVTDYHMPGLNGLEFLEAAGRIRPGLPAVMITAHAAELAASGTPLPPMLKSIVSKPFKWTELAGEISRHWEGSRPPFPIAR